MLTHFPSLLLISVSPVMPDAGEGVGDLAERTIAKNCQIQNVKLGQLEKMDKVLGPVRYASDL